MDEDIGLMPDSDKKAVKQGRRAQPVKGAHQTNRQVDLDDSILEKSHERRRQRDDPVEIKKTTTSSLLDDDEEEEDMAPRRKQGGKLKSTWDVDTGRGADAYDDERLIAKASKQDSSDAESESDIPMIPELEDTKEAVPIDSEEGIVSISPGVVTKVATYRELEDDLMKHLPFLTLDQEVDLKPLTKFLIPENVTVESDTPWEWETLYAEVASELMKEIEHLQLSPGTSNL